MERSAIGIIGLGIGKWHPDSFKQRKRAEVVAVCDVNEQRLKERAGADKEFPTQFEHFLECIIRDSERISLASDGLAVLKMLDAMCRSSKTGRAVRIRDEAE